MKLQSLKMFEMTKDMFYKLFEFFANWRASWTLSIAAIPLKFQQAGLTID